MSTQLDWSSLQGLPTSQPVVNPQQQQNNPVAPAQSSPPTSQLDWSSLEGAPGYQVNDTPQQDGTLKTVGRYAAQPLIGAAEFTTPGLLASGWEMLGTGEALAEMQDWEDGREAELRQKFPTAPWPDKPVYDKEKYMKALEAASKTVPTAANIAAFIEDQTGMPLKANTRGQRLLRLAGGAGKIKPGGFGEKVIASVVAPTVSATAKALGVPEWASDLIGLGASAVAPKPGIETVTKASGMPTRWYESLKKDTKLTPSQYGDVKIAVEGDVKRLTTDLIKKESETARILEADPSFPDKINDTFSDVERLAGNIKETVPTKELKANYIKKVNSNTKGNKGISPDEFDQAYAKEARKLAKTIPGKDEASMAKLVEQYRKNNASFKELYEPGQSGALNRAKREALLDYNRTIAETFEAKHPDSEFNKLFKYSNKKYSELMDLDNINGFMDKVFGDKKINYKEANKFFRDKKAQRAFKNILGEDGFKDMESIMKDFLPTEKAMSLLKKGEALGFGDMMKTGFKWSISPAWGKLAALKKGSVLLRNKLLSKPKFRITWDSALKDLKKGNFKEAQAGFKELDAIEQSTLSKVKDIS